MKVGIPKMLVSCKMKEEVKFAHLSGFSFFFCFWYLISTKARAPPVV